MTSPAFVACVVFLLTHELDAVYRKEWRLLPILRRWDDEKAARCFIVLHLPLIYVILMALMPNAPDTLREGVCVFAIIHVALHFFWPRSDLYLFDNYESRFLIWGAGIAGLLYFIV